MSFIRNNKTAFAAICIGIAFLAIGVWRGEAETIFRKAINICMECIGLG